MVARKHLDDAAADGKPIADVQDAVEEQWAKVPRLTYLHSHGVLVCGRRRCAVP